MKNTETKIILSGGVDTILRSWK